MDKYENTFYLRLYQNDNSQLVKSYIQGLCDKLDERSIEFHMDLYLDNIFQDEVYDGGRGPNTTYPYVRFEKSFDDIGNYFSFNSSQMSDPILDMTPNTYLQDNTISSIEDVNESSNNIHSCSELLAKIPNDVNNEIIVELTIKTDTPQLYRNGGIVQLEYLIQNI